MMLGRAAGGRVIEARLKVTGQLDTDQWKLIRVFSLPLWSDAAPYGAWGEKFFHGLYR